MVDVTAFARPISDAARIVKHGLPSSNTLELCDLVQIGWERVTRYLQGSESASTTLVFVCAKQGMLDESARWACKAWETTDGKRSKRGFARKRRTGPAPVLVGYDELFRCEPAPPIEALIDAYRALLAMPLKHAAAWYDTCWLENSQQNLRREFRVSQATIGNWVAAARAELAR